jgi:uncharacterized membrane-anchored protein
MNQDSLSSVKNNSEMDHAFISSKVPIATAGFWAIKILATTVGEVGGNWASMDMGLGYLQATAILAGLFIFLAFMQIMTRCFHPILYWGTIVASTTVGTTLADYVTRSIGIGYTGGSLLLLGLVIVSLITWHRALGRISADDIIDRRAECFYWITITFSQTLGTALGDWFADTAGFGYAGSSVIFGLVLLSIIFLYYRSKLNGAVLFWAAFVITRPFGAVVGNFFDKPIDHGGLAISRVVITCVLLGLMALGVWLLPQRAKKIYNKN